MRDIPYLNLLYGNTRIMHHTLIVEKVFNTPEQLQKGLMYDYNPLSPNACAVFVLDQTRHMTVWMKNTPCALDIIFIRNDMTISDIHIGAIPYDTTKITSNEPVKYMVEVLTGYCKTFDIKVGDRITFQHANLEGMSQSA